MEALARAGGTGAVGAVAGEQHADVHFVGPGFQPAEVAFDAIPGLGPAVVLAVVGVSIHDPALGVGRQVSERDVEGDSFGSGGLDQVALAFRAHSGLPGTDRAFGEGFGAIGNGAGVIDGDDPAEALAGRAGADGMVETEEGRGRLAVLEVAGGAVQMSREVPRGVVGGGLRFGRGRSQRESDGETAMAEVVGLFARFDEPGTSAGFESDAVLDDGEGGRVLQGGMIGGVVDAEDTVAGEQTSEALAGDEGELVGKGQFGGEGEIEGDQAFASGVSGAD